MPPSINIALEESIQSAFSMNFIFMPERILLSNENLFKIYFNDLSQLYNSSFFPSFKVNSKYDNDTRKFIIDYTIYKDITTKLSKIVTINMETIYPLYDKFLRTLKNGDITTEQKFDLILGSKCISAELIPSNGEVIVAFIIWFYTYIGFMGGCGWNNGIDSSPCIPEVNFDFSMYDINHVDYMFDKKFLQSSSVLLEIVYQLIPISYHRWWSVAQFSGWKSLICPEENV